MTEIEEKIKEILNKNNVEIGYLFGSYASGKNNKLSDIDIAILFSNLVNEKEMDDAEDTIKYQIIKDLNVKKADLINLRKNNNKALRHEILFKGKPLIVKNYLTKRYLELKAVRDFEDTRKLREVQFNILRKKFNVTS